MLCIICLYITRSYLYNVQLDIIVLDRISQVYILLNVNFTKFTIVVDYWRKLWGSFYFTSNLQSNEYSWFESNIQQIFLSKRIIIFSYGCGFWRLLVLCFQSHPAIIRSDDNDNMQTFFSFFFLWTRYCNNGYNKGYKRTHSTIVKTCL